MSCNAAVTQSGQRPAAARQMTRRQSIKGSCCGKRFLSYFDISYFDIWLLPRSRQLPVGLGDYGGSQKQFNGRGSAANLSSAYSDLP
jgi:hypothetical protein